MAEKNSLFYLFYIRCLMDDTRTEGSGVLRWKLGGYSTGIIMEVHFIPSRWLPCLHSAVLQFCSLRMYALHAPARWTNENRGRAA